MKSIGIGLIGTGFMGKCHALAYGAVKAVFGDVPAPRLEVLCDTPLEHAETMASQFGFGRATDDWRALIADPAVDLVSITTPNRMHREMAMAALAAGKHVHCEKPMALTLDEAFEMAAAAGNAPGRTMVGYNYIRNPAFIHAQKLVTEGAIGRLTHFRGQVDEDYQADPDLEWTWRATRADAGLGALGDMGCHLVSVAMGLAGPIDSLIADIQTIYETRPEPGGQSSKPVENEDVASALVRFTSGIQGILTTSRSAWGRKCFLAFEIHGDKGMIRIDFERMNELMLYQNTGPVAEQGFKRVLTSPAHEPYGRFCPAPGHQLGFNDLKLIEVHAFLTAIAKNKPAYPSFADALEIEKVIHAIHRAATDGTRVAIGAM
ncbi:MAG: Gfo/Idh/MocA family oxidoreductase [Alphaproteobacteria bacterium]|nr:Gfo/Idh/MocA family oxidoreductase [Alphaproteobacteria bacterium]